jgi:putative membrane protein
MNMKKWFLFLASAASISFFSCSKDEDTPRIINPQDKGFVHLLTLNNMAEVVLGQLAADSSQTPAIKEFGQQMVAEHSANAAELEALASRLGIATPDTLTSRHEQLRQQLLTLKGNSFDSLYILNQVADHRTTINLLENAHSLGNNTELKDFARGLLPHIFQHLQEAETLAAPY